jgi:hypothetical protein
MYPPILGFGTEVDSLADAKVAAVMAPVALPLTPDGLPLQTMLFEPNQDADETDSKLNPQIITLYSKGEIQRDDTILDLLGGGGAIFDQIASYGKDAALVKDTIGDHATIIKLGELDAALVESTTWPGDFRSHALYWSDGRLDFTLMIAGSSEEVVKVGQSLYCG